MMKEINNLKGMLVVGYLIEKMQRFRLPHAAGQRYMPHHCVPCGVQGINNESKINSSVNGRLFVMHARSSSDCQVSVYITSWLKS